MNQTPSEKLAAWVEEKLQTQSPGFRFPSDSELAASFSLSPRTVERTLKKYKDSGQLLRIRGRGTFIPGGEELSPRSPQPSRSSSQSIVDVMRDAICSGNLMKGEPLPQVKYMSRKFKAGAATVSEAYRQLERMGYVVKIGKTFWVGSFDTIVRPRPHMEVFVFKYKSLDFGDIFTTDMLAPALRKMERELINAGFILRFESTDNLADILQTFHRQRRMPHGLVFHRIGEQAFAELYPVVKQFFQSMKNVRDVKTPVLVDWDLGGIFDKIPRRVQVFSRGHISTSTSRAVGRYLVGNKYRSIAFFVDQTKPLWNIPAMSGLLKTWVEVRNLNRSMRLKYVILGETRVKTAGDFGRWFLEWHGSHLQRQLSKYGDIPVTDFTQNISLAKSIEQALLDHRDADLWIFSNAAHAVRACEWCDERSLKIPRDISIISLEHDHLCYHLGISYCDVDWEKIGYVMAHTITGALPVLKTTKGFIRTEARVVERLTTK
ncbi:MAG: GntR family transcriptional regulator [Chitinivibrionales bacterium]|nr:GntR family transcriptional regulator [Chitinivibrionales bacterium]MBD3394834.1 GntR family transcriptional regulator [Chitinivibrionales bacterium]